MSEIRVGQPRFVVAVVVQVREIALAAAELEQVRAFAELAQVLRQEP